MSSNTRGSASLLLLGCIGIALCAYLTYLHLGLLRGELLGGVACGSGGLFNCHAVTASRWGSLFGIPLSLWGLLGYLAVVQLALFAWCSPERRPQALVLLLWLSALLVAVDAALAAVMTVQVRHLCPLCLLTYLVNLLLLLGAKRALGVSWAQAWRRLPEAWAALQPSGGRPFGGVFWTVMVGGLLGIVAFHAGVVFVTRSSPSVLRGQLREFVTHQPSNPPDATGDPSLGVPGGALQVVEFSDFLCPVCRRASRFNEIMLTNHRGTVRFVFKHFPLDLTCNTRLHRTAHPGACTIAAASECAHRQGKFWPFHDLVFRHDPIPPLPNLVDEAVRAGLDRASFDACMASGEGMEAVRRDVAEGERLGVSSTPTYFLNGYRFGGIIQPYVLDEIADVLQEPR